MKIKRLPAGFVVPARLKLQSRRWATSGFTKSNMMATAVTVVRLYSRNAYDWTVRLTAIAAAAELIMG
jgi:hypothetical protein